MSDILRRIPRKLWVVALVPVLLVIVVIVVVSTRCEYRNTVPEAPIHPNSVLVNSELSGTGGSRPLATYYYEANSPVEEVIQFYSEQADCSVAEATSNIVCRGNATPFGEYFVYVEAPPGLASGVTQYAVELRWQGCTFALD